MFIYSLTYLAISSISSCATITKTSDAQLTVPVNPRKYKGKKLVVNVHLQHKQNLPSQDDTVKTQKCTRLITTWLATDTLIAYNLVLVA